MAMSTAVQDLLTKAFADRDALGNMNTKLAKDQADWQVINNQCTQDHKDIADLTTVALASAHAAIDALTKEIT